MEEIMSLEEFEFTHRPRVKNNTAKKELITFNINTELEAITEKPSKNIYDLAMLLFSNI